METWAVMWGSAGAIALAVDLCLWYRRLSGALGPTVLEQSRWYLALNGGLRQMAWVMLLVNFVCPPVALVVCLTTYRIDRQTCKLERQRLAPPT